MRKNIKDLTGCVFSKWSVTKLSPRKGKPDGGAYWDCLCVCGFKGEISSKSLLRGSSKGCASCAAKQKIVDKALQRYCTKCSVVLLEKKNWFPSNKEQRTYLCNVCRNSPEKREQSRARLLKRYQLTPASYAALLSAQNGVCAICGKPPRKISLAVDHNHACCNVGKYGTTCGKCTRGLLCGFCNNKLLGRIEHAHIDPRKIVLYFQKYGQFL